MSFATYSDLQTSIGNYLARSDLTSQIPDFITFAENRLRRELRIRQMLKSVTTATVSGDNTIEIPRRTFQLGGVGLNSCRSRIDLA